MRTDGCAWMRSRLPLLAGDELMGPERRRAERHLIGCPSCRRLLASHRGALDVLHAASASGPSPRLPGGASLWPALEREIRESRRSPEPRGARFWPLAGAWSAVALAAVLALASAWPSRPTKAPVATQSGPTSTNIAATPKAPAASPGTTPAPAPLPRLASVRPGRKAPKEPPAKVDAPAAENFDYDLERSTPESRGTQLVY